MAGQKLLPTRLLFPLRRRLDSVPLQYAGDRTACPLVPQIGQGALNPTITPIAVLFGHAHHQCFHFSSSARSPWSTLSTTVVLLRNQFPMPRQQSLRRDDRGHVR